MPGVAMPGHQEGPREGPAWLKAFLGGTYFTPCHYHAAAHKSERNFFCTDCGGESLCSLCVQKHHSGSGHTTMQVRRSSYHEVVRISDIQKLIDTSTIQVYVINSAKIVFLNGRPQAKPQKGAPYYCETCQRTLLDACRFCSIGCKLAAIKHDETLTLQPRLQTGVGAPPSPLLGRGSHGGAEAEISGDSASKGALQGKRGFDWRKVQLPPLLLDAGESDEGSDDSGSGRDDAEGQHPAKRKRVGEEKGMQGGYGGQVGISTLVEPSSPTSSLLPPGTPTQFAGADWKVIHRRKSIPQRAPLW